MRTPRTLRQPPSVLIVRSVSDKLVGDVVLLGADPLAAQVHGGVLRVQRPQRPGPRPAPLLPVPGVAAAAHHGLGALQTAAARVDGALRQLPLPPGALGLPPPLGLQPGRDTRPPAELQDAV